MWHWMKLLSKVTVLMDGWLEGWIMDVWLIEIYITFSLMGNEAKKTNRNHGNKVRSTCGT